MTGPCEKMRDKIVDSVLDGLRPDEIKVLDEHIHQCPPCRLYADTLQREKQNLLQLGESLDTLMEAREINVIETLYQISRKEARLPSLGRTLMRSRKIQYTAAAVILIAFTLSISMMVLNIGTAKPAYALEQTIEANHSIRTMHLRAYYNGEEGDENYEKAEVWMKYDEAGLLTNLSVNHFKYENGKLDDDSIMFGVWNEGVSRTFLPLKNVVIVLRVNNTADQCEKFIREYNPTLILQQIIDRAQDYDDMEIEIQEPQQDGDPIYVVAIQPRHLRTELTVDPETKLVQQYVRIDLNENPEEEKFEVKLEFLAYNQTIDPSVFELSGIPDDAHVYDQVDQLVGLEKGDLTDEEIASLVVSKALEATIAQDYDEVSRLMEGDPGDAIEQFIAEQFGAKLVRVISLGQPAPHHRWKNILCVPCEIEVEGKDGVRRAVSIIATAKAIDYQPGNRWIVHTALYNPQVGLAQGDLTDEDIAYLLVHEALEATIARDYEEVRRLTIAEFGESGDWIEKYIAEKFAATLVQIIAFDTPKLHGNSNNLYCVPCTVEVENEAGQRRREDLKVYVRSLTYEPGNRWALLYDHIRTEEMKD